MWRGQALETVHELAHGYHDQVLGFEEKRIEAAVNKAAEHYGVGVHGARLLAGTFSIHVEMEAALAKFKKTEAATVLTSGYATGIAAITSLMGRHDVVVADRLNHASLVDGCLLSGARFERMGIAPSTE